MILIEDTLNNKRFLGKKLFPIYLQNVKY